MTTRRGFLVAVALLILGVPRLQAAEEVAKLTQQAEEAVERFQKADSTLGPLIKEAAGYVVFPRVAKGGLVFGGAKGDGLVFEKGKPVGRATLTQGTFGAQIGGQIFREIILFETSSALDSFKQSKVEMSAQVGAVAAAEGVGKNAKYTDGVLVITQPLKGLMAEASVGGQKFQFEALP
jgi:lipid-binding SYLF domain-containing protein